MICFISVNFIVFLYVYVFYDVLRIYNNMHIIPEDFEEENVTYAKLTLLLFCIPVIFNIIFFYLNRAKDDMGFFVYIVNDLVTRNSYLTKQIEDFRKREYPVHIKSLILEKYRDKEDCPICLVLLNNDISITLCGHVFHQECLKSALDVKKKCPCCREIIQ